MELLDALLQRSVIVVLAISGACIATLGGYLMRERSKSNRRIARRILRAGYALAWFSIALFIVAGFRSAYR
jgi:hypothetical protein